jgi:nitrate reductase (NAD(P)H)
VEIQKVSHDSRLFRFALHGDQQRLGLPTGQHCFVRLRRKASDRYVVEGELVQRAYTPVSFRSTGHVDFLVKVYAPTVEFPNGGKMSQGLDELALGDTVELKGPVGSFVHLGKGMVKWRGQERSVKKFGLICGGTGERTTLATRGI